MEKIRLSKLMSQQGLCSRREADNFIEQGWVLVDGERITELGTKIYPAQKITLDKAAQAQQLEQVTLLLNKPIGYVSGQPEPGYRPAISLVNHGSRFEGDRGPQRFNPMHLRGLAPAGRLDIDSSGLLVFTQDGRIARQLIGEGLGGREGVPGASRRETAPKGAGVIEPRSKPGRRSTEASQCGMAK